jgi:hypothetical protein
MALLCSINWARILVQIGHFVYAYLQATDFANKLLMMMMMIYRTLKYTVPKKHVFQKHFKNAGLDFRVPPFLGPVPNLITIRTRTL